MKKREEFRRRLVVFDGRHSVQVHVTFFRTVATWSFQRKFDVIVINAKVDMTLHSGYRCAIHAEAIADSGGLESVISSSPTTMSIAHSCNVSVTNSKGRPEVSLSQRKR